MRTLFFALLLTSLSVPACAEQPAARPDPNVRIFDLPGEGRVHVRHPAPLAVIIRAKF